MSTALMHEFIEPREREVVASPFYSHPYGGVARDIAVTREGFMRFFELDEHELSLGEGFPGVKVYDTFHDDWAESYGCILMEPTRLIYRITVINRDHTRVGELLQIAPYLWEGNDDCDPHGIERPTNVWEPTVIEEGPIIWGSYTGPAELY